MRDHSRRYIGGLVQTIIFQTDFGFPVGELEGEQGEDLRQTESLLWYL